MAETEARVLPSYFGEADLGPEEVSWHGIKPRKSIPPEKPKRTHQMGRVLLVAGASGAGKSFLLEHVRVSDSRLFPIKKLTTRDPRDYETERPEDALDLEFSKDLTTVRTCEYRYKYASEWYGIEKSKIDQALRSGYSPVLIVRSSAVIRRIKNDYPDALVLYLQSALSGEDLKKKLAKQGREDIEIEERMRRLSDDFHDYVKHLHLYDYVIINYFDESSLIEQIEDVLIHELPASPSDERLVFVLMSFSQDMANTYKALKSAGKLVSPRLRVHRVDDKSGQYKITESILKNIELADLIVCDLTKERPNVYYELGFAQALGKTVLTCARGGTKLHFDIKDFRTIFYESAIELQGFMEREFVEFFGLGAAT